MFSAEALRARNNGTSLDFIQSQSSVSYAPSSPSTFPTSSSNQPSKSSIPATGFDASTSYEDVPKTNGTRNAHSSSPSHYTMSDSDKRKTTSFELSSFASPEQNLPIFAEQPSFTYESSSPYAGSGSRRPASTTFRNHNPDEVDLSRFSREALENRVRSLERLLAEAGSSSSGAPRGTDAELSEHLRVTVKRNRELRVQAEKMKGDIAQLVADREKFAKLVASQNLALEAHIEETTRAKEMLADTIDSLSQEKAALAARCEGYEQTVDELQEQLAAQSLRLNQLGNDKNNLDSFLSPDANLQDVPLIAEAIHTAMEQLRISRSPD